MSDDVPFSPWRDRDVLAIAIGRSVSFLGELATLTVLTLRVHDGGGGPAGVTALLVAGFLPFVVLLPVTGRLVDRLPRRRVVVVSTLLQAAVAGVLAMHTPVVATVALAFVLGAGQSVAGAAWQALLAEVVDRERLTPALGVVQSLRTVAGIAAPGVAGLLVGSLGTGAPMIGVAAVFLATAALALRVHVPAAGSGTAAGPGRGPATAAVPRTAGSWALVRADPLLRALLVLFGVLITLTSMDNVVEVFFVRDTLHASPTWYGATMTIWAVGMLVGSLSGRLWNRPDDPQPALVAATLWSTLALVALVGAFAFVPSVAWLVPVSVGGGLANGVLNLASSALVLHRAPPGAVGRVSALVSAVTSGGQAGSMLLGGVLLGVLSPRAIYAVAGAVGVALVLAVGPALLRAGRTNSVTADTR